MSSEAQARELARLRWQCRRGMLELDEILDAYVSEQYQRASADEQETFRRLLDHQDPELQQWLLLGADPGDEGLRKLIKKLRKA